jgi:hypothetical protein
MGYHPNWSRPYDVPLHREAHSEKGDMNVKESVSYDVSMNI